MKYKPSLTLFRFVLAAFLIENAAFVAMDNTSFAILQKWKMLVDSYEKQLHQPAKISATAQPNRIATPSRS